MRHRRHDVEQPRAGRQGSNLRFKCVHLPTSTARSLADYEADRLLGRLADEPPRLDGASPLVVGAWGAELSAAQVSERCRTTGTTRRLRHGFWCLGSEHPGSGTGGATVRIVHDKRPASSNNGNAAQVLAMQQQRTNLPVEDKRPKVPDGGDVPDKRPHASHRGSGNVRATAAGPGRARQRPAADRSIAARSATTCPGRAAAAGPATAKHRPVRLPGRQRAE